MGPALQDDFPEVEASACLFLRYGGGVVRYGEHTHKEDLVFHADPSFLTLFSYPMLRGDRRSALDAPNTAVIAEATARKYFGDADPLGRRIRFGTDEEYTITGVMRSPQHSHLTFNFLLSFATLEQLPWARLDDYAWNWYDFFTYVRLQPRADPQALEAKLPAFIERHKSATDRANHRLSLQPLPSIHLHSDLIQEARPNGDATTIYGLSVIALFVLTIAWINYVNLATAQATERAKEVGIRKVVGARRRQLVRQFLIEAALLNVAAALLALLILQLALPLYNAWAGQDLALSLTSQPVFWIALLTLFAAGAFLSGLYPAFVLSAYQPARVLKGAFLCTRRGLPLRKALVVGQFVASVGLIAGTLIIYQQLRYMHGRDLGIDIAQMLVVEAPGVVGNDSLYTHRVESFKQELLKRTGIKRAAASTEIPGNLIYWASGKRRREAPPAANTILYQAGIDYDYLDTYGHLLLAGRGFNRAFPADSQRVILTEAAVQALGFAGSEEALGAQLVGGPDTLSVVGVVADYHQEGVHKTYDPIGFRLGPPGQNTWSYFALKVDTGDLGSLIEYVSETFTRFFPGNPFNHYFLDDYFDRQYRSYRQFGQVVGAFALLAIVIACLGLFGLASFAVTQRTKEIGVRKVLGATVVGIVALLSKDFIKLVLLGSLLAVPPVWWLMSRWLEGFAFRTSISAWTFAGAVGLVAAIAVLTVSYQALRAALADPTQSLRYE